MSCLSCRQNINLLRDHQNIKNFLGPPPPSNSQKLQRKFHFLEFVESCSGMLQHHLFCDRFSVSRHPSHTCEVQIGLFWKNNKGVLLCFICSTPKIKPSQNQEAASVLSRGISFRPEWNVKGSPPARKNLHV